MVTVRVKKKMVVDRSKKKMAAEEEIKKIADDFGGLDIFSEENKNKLVKALNTISHPFEIARDRLLVANLKKIPQRLYAAVGLPKKEQQKLIDTCLDDLISLGFTKKVCVEIVSWLVHLLFSPVQVKKLKI